MGETWNLEQLEAELTTAKKFDTHRFIELMLTCNNKHGYAISLSASGGKKRPLFVLFGYFWHP
jgi:hypothetical protein